MAKEGSFAWGTEVPGKGASQKKSIFLGIAISKTMNLVIMGSSKVPKFGIQLTKFGNKMKLLM